LCKQAILFKVASILVQRYVDDAIENSKDAFRSFKTLLVFKILVPKRMCQEIESRTFGRAFKKPTVELCQPDVL
jgi:hypothetical protein